MSSTLPRAIAAFAIAAIAVTATGTGAWAPPAPTSWSTIPVGDAPIGPWLALATMASVLTLEAFLLHDGGTAALGANVLVMGVAGVLVGYGAYRAIVALGARRHRGSSGPSLWTKASAAAVGAWLSVMASALTLASLVAIGGATTIATLNGTPEATIVDLIPRYAAWGLLEAVITGAAVAAGLAWNRSVIRLEVAAGVRRHTTVSS